MNPLYKDERFGVIISLIVALWVGFYFTTPTSLWFTVRTMEINDARDWQGVTVDFDRTIHREFHGQWFAKVRRKEAQGWVTYATTPTSDLIYQEDSQLPVPVTLEWLLWTEAKAYQLPCGEYEVAVTWTVNPDAWFLRRDITRAGTFKIWGGKGCTR